MRKTLAAVLFALSGALLLLTAFALQNLFEEYKDSADSVYIATAAVTFGLGVVAAVGGALLLRERER